MKNSIIYKPLFRPNKKQPKKELPYRLELITTVLGVVCAIASILISIFQIVTDKSITKLESLIETQGTIIQNQNKSIDEIKSIAFNSLIMKERLINLNSSSNDILQKNIEQLKINGELLSVNQNLFNKYLFRSKNESYSELSQLHYLFDEVKLHPLLLTKLNAGTASGNDLYPYLKRFVENLKKGYQISYLFEDNLCFKKWTSFFDLCNGLKTKIGRLENLEPQDPEWPLLELEKLFLTKDIKNEMSYFSYYYNDLNHYFKEKLKY